VISSNERLTLKTVSILYHISNNYCWSSSWS